MVSDLHKMDEGETIPPIEIPDHELISLIGEGSYGQVWIARSTIGTYRAVKIVRRDSFRHERPFEREIEGIRRFEPISRTHPGLVAILHVGQSSDGNCFYYVMELGDDVNSGGEIDPRNYQVKSLANAVWDNGRLPVDRCIELGLSLSDALAYLHEQDLIHRDVKPANIVFVSGYPKLADIGLVTDTSSANTYVGTEGFIPPEGPNSGQADVYSLGKTLYEIATGQDRNQFPSLPSAILSEGENDGLLELIEIINQACHHDRSLRYQSARAMHAEITALANGRSIRRLRLLERRVSTFNRVFKIVGAVLLPVIILAFFIYQEREARLRDTNRAIGSLEVDSSRDLDTGDYAEALRKVADAWALAPEDERNSRLQSFRASQILAQIPTLTHYWLADSAITSLRFTDSGDFLFVGGDKGLVARYTVSDGNVMRFPGHIGDVRSIDINEKEGLLASAGAGQEVKLWSLNSGESVGSFKHPVSLWAVKFAPDGKRFVSGGDSVDGKGHFYVWNVGDSDQPQLAVPINGSIRGFDFSHDGELLAVASGDSAYLFHMDHLASQSAFSELIHSERVFDIQFVDDGKRVVTACQDGRYRVFKVGEDSAEYESSRQQFGVRGVHESADERYIATAGWDSTVLVRTRISGDLLSPKLYHSGRVNAVRFGPDGHRLAAGASDGTLRIWDLAGRRVTQRVRGTWDASRAGILALYDEESKEIRSLINGKEGRQIPKGGQQAEDLDFALSTRSGYSFLTDYSSDGDVRVTVQDLLRPELEPIQLSWETPEPIQRHDVSEDDQYIVLAGQRSFQLFYCSSGAAVWPARELGSNISDVFFAPSGKELVVQHEDEVRVLRCADLSEVTGPFRTEYPIAHVAIDSSNSVLALSNSDDGLEERSCFLFEYHKSKAPCAELRHRDGVDLSVFDPSGARVLTASEDATVRLWAADTGERMLDPIKHRDGIKDAIFSPDGEYLLTSCGDRTVRIWDSMTGFPVSPPIEFSHEVGFVAFEQGGRRLICQTPGGNVTWTWSLSKDLPSPHLLRAYASVLNGVQLDRSQSKDGILSGWRAVKRESRNLVEVDRDELLAWHRHQLFEATLRLFQLPKLYEDDEFEFWERVENFHLQRLQDLTGESMAKDLEYSQRVHGIVEDRRLQERLKQ